MTEFTKRTMLFFVGVTVVVFGAWLGGCNFNERGGELLTVYAISILTGLWLAAMPNIKGDA